MKEYNVTIEYFIETGAKEEYYTLWKEVKVDTGYESLEESNGFQLGYLRYYFVQNLSKTREGAIEKVKELGLDISESKFSFELRHKGKPSVEAFGEKLKFKNDKWYAKANKAFFDAWRTNKEVMKEMGWICWKWKDVWYMGIKFSEN